MKRNEKHEPEERGDGSEREREGSTRAVERRRRPRGEDASEGAPSEGRGRSPISWLEKPADWI